VLVRLSHPALGAKHLDAARVFYEDHFGPSPWRETDAGVLRPVGSATATATG
jgi:catechol 2,3-dioxygenase-like lactoylglutathione lyase family enzyme